MINTRLDQILEMVKSGHILTEAAFATVDLNHVLSVYERNDTYKGFFTRELEHRWRILPLHPDLRGIYQELQDVTQDVVVQQLHIYASLDFEYREGQDLVDELALRIQSDLDQIAMSRATEYYTTWHDELWRGYQRDEIPCFDMRPFVERASQFGPQTV